MKRKPWRNGLWILLLLLSTFVGQIAAENKLLAELLPSQAATAQTSNKQVMQLRLKCGGYGLGHLISSPLEDLVAWQNEGFAEPFQIQTSAIRSITSVQAHSQQPSSAQDAFAIETDTGERLIGELLALDEQALTVRSPVLGTVQVDRDRLVTLSRQSNVGEIVYSGIVAKQPFKFLSDPQDWQRRTGSLTATRQGAAIQGDFNLPAQAEISLSLSWTGAPDFTVALGASSQPKQPVQAHTGARLEVWDRRLVLVRETDTNADVVKLSELNDYDTQVDLNILLDQTTGLVVVRDMFGRRLGSLSLTPSGDSIGVAMQFVNHGPSLTVQRLEVRQWDGRSRIGGQDGTYTLLRDGTKFNDWMMGFDPQSGLVTLADADGKRREVPLSSIAEAALRQPEKDDAESTSITATATAFNEAHVEIVLNDTSRLRGKVLASTSQNILLQSVSCELPLPLEPNHISAIIGSSQRFQVVHSSRRNGVLKTGESELPGSLDSDVTGVGAECLRWQPWGSLNSSSLLPSAAGNIVYRQHLPVTREGAPTGRLDGLLPSPAVGADLMATITSGVSPAIAQSTESTAVAENKDEPAESQPPTVAREIIFASGDSIDGYVQKIDQLGVYLQSSQTQVGFVAHDRLSRLSLNPLAATVKQPSAEKLERLMTVPRALRHDPPSHLLLSVNGDFLRGSLVGLDEHEAVMELRRETARIPRQQIAQIVWLRDRQWEQSASPDNEDATLAAKEPSPYQVHVVQQGRGWTLHPTGIQSEVLHGTSSLLGECSVPLQHVSQLMFGPDLETRVWQSKQNAWVLSLAKLPKVFAESDTSGGKQQWPLIGQQAPEFSLAGLDGQTVQLSELSGKVVVLDFWASWCEPCMISLPQIGVLLHDFDNQKVQWIGINLQETEGRAQAAAERLGVQFRVCLDRNGQVARKYLANSIPQTVVVDQHGIVRHVWNQSGSRLMAELRLAIEELLGPSK
ncbi:MAG: TlpA family protein disulfide reductase [Pirellulaceae bacterium]|nr:TlpA family protein disulfide reductase [Pirellulaceae bacterium]